MKENHEINYCIDCIKFRPFDRTSKIFGEKPGTEHFDGRHDHLLFRNQLGIGVLLTIANRLHDAEHPRGQRITLKVYLIDTDADSPVWSGAVSHRFPARQAKAEIRLDIPLPYLHTIPTHNYIIQVDDDHSGITLRREHLRFYDLPQLRRLPTKWYIPCSGIANLNREEDVLDLKFFMIADFEPIKSRMPELEIRLYLPNGIVESKFQIPSRCEEDTVETSTSFSIGQPCDGIAFAELRCMGHPFSGFLFDCGKTNIMQFFRNDCLHTFPDYTPEIARRKYDSIHDNIPITTKMDDDATEENSSSQETIMEASEESNEEIIEEEATETISPLTRLDSLTGLTEVKRKVREYTDLARFMSLRSQAGLPELPIALHSLFIGSPGTGKTTVAKIMGYLMKEAGVLSRGHVVIRERATLLGQFYNSEAEKTLEALEEAQGGILFIDEAYQLYQPEDPRDPGKFVLETLMTALADESKRDWMLILAGYPGPTKRMLEMNPGLASRIPESNHYQFEDFSPAELIDIANNYLMANGFSLTPEADISLRQTITEDYRNRPANFGNGRYVMNLIQTRIIPTAASRIVKLAGTTTTSDILSRIEASDIPAPEFLSPQRPRLLGFRA